MKTTKIIIERENKDSIALDIEDARVIYEELKKLFEQTTMTEPKPCPYPHPHPPFLYLYPTYDIYTDTSTSTSEKCKCGHKNNQL